MMLIPAVLSVASWLYVRTVQQSLGPVPTGTEIMIPLDIQVIDEATGRPIQGAWIDLPFLHPAWRSRPDRRGLDLRLELAPAESSPLPFLTNRDGRITVAAKAGVERRLESYAYGFLSKAGSPEVAFPPVAGIRASAEGYEIWTTYLDDVRKERGLRLAGGAPLTIVARLKPAPPMAPSISRGRQALMKPRERVDFLGFSERSVRASKARDL
jgi:hypothetical protein